MTIRMTWYVQCTLYIVLGALCAQAISFISNVGNVDEDTEMRKTISVKPVSLSIQQQITVQWQRSEIQFALMRTKGKCSRCVWGSLRVFLFIFHFVC